MLKKLIKYDLKWSLKVVVIYLILSFSFSVIGRLMDFLPDSFFFAITKGICKGAGVGMGVTALVNGVIRSWVRIITNMYKDESYLTHTLPIETNKHFYSKIISTIIVCCLCIVVSVISIVICYLNETTIEYLKTTFNILSTNLNTSITLLIIIMTLIIILEILFITLCGITGIIYGYSYNNKKISKSFIFGLMFYGISTGIIFLIVLICSLFSKNLFNLIFNGVETIDYKSLKFILIGCSLLYGLVNLALIFIGNHKLKKGINID